MPAMKNDASIMQQRIRAAWRARACAVSIAVGAQIFAVGAGVCMPLCLNAAWLSVLPAAILVLPAVWLARRSLARRKEKPSRMLCVLLFVTLLAGCAFLIAALTGLAEQSILPQSRLLYSSLTTLAIAVLCVMISRSTGVCRLSFAMRILLPAGLLVFSALAIPFGQSSGPFPLLGTGLPLVGLASLGALCGVLPVIMLLLPPSELTDEQAGAAHLPGTGFFLWRIGLGALCGVLLTLALSLCNTYETMTAQNVWGERMRIVSSGKPGEGLFATMLVIGQVFALMLSAVCMLGAAEQALVRAWSALQKYRLGLLLSAAILCAVMVVFVLFGFDWALRIIPFCAVPAWLVLLMGRRV